MTVFRAVIEKRGMPDRFGLTSVGRSMASLVPDAFFEPQATVTGQFGANVDPENVIRAFAQRGWRVRSLVLFAEGAGEELLHELTHRHDEPPPPPQDDLD